MSNNNLDHLFKKALQDKSCEPPPQVWENIRLQLEQRKRKTMIWWWRSAAAVAFIFISIGFWQLRDIQPAGEKYVAVIKENINDTVFIKKIDIVKIATNKEALKMQQPSTLFAAQKSLDTPLVSAINHLESIPNSTPDLRLKSEKLNQNFIPLTSKEALQNKLAYQALLAENIQEPEPQKSVKFTVSGHFVPAYSSGNYSSSVTDTRGRAYSQKQMNGLMNAGGGLRVSMAANKRLSIQTGIFYSRMGQQTDQRSNNAKTAAFMLANPKEVVATPLGNIKTRTQPVAFRSEQATVLNNIVNTDETLEQVFGSLEIPLQMRYALNNNKLRFSISGGLCGNFIVNNKVYLKSGDNKELMGSTEDIRNFNLSTDWGLGMEYPLGRKVKIMLEPGFRYFLQSLSQNESIDFKPYMFTLSTGIGIAF